MIYFFAMMGDKGIRSGAGGIAAIQIKD